MKLTVEQLHDTNSYELIDSFHVDEMGKFLMQELGIKQPDNQPTKPKLNAKSLLFFAVFAGIGGVVGWSIGKFIPKSEGGLDTFATQFGLAFLCFFIVLLPIHEAIHGLFFKLIGAQKVGFGWSMKSLIVYAYAQKFVMTLRENALVAAMPFVVITISLTVLWFIFPQWQFFWGSALFLHTFACMGDFILIRYFYKNRTSRMYTYDDIEEKNYSYFFREKSRKPSDD
ncbi:hypothetical protein GVN20_07460 [Runella sp. CRIBMP]|uniref:DUF3267 domain-containing protein n=1 Tax=Runella sp. CRIBMP TaxID=2683261 RepID=UPI00141367E7|nr:DUF3267 domain-containing protein [Runella sp. CRIBMP]NBB19187.1 hypothetical protein [Runella sp. CRIBMP]